MSSGKWRPWDIVLWWSEPGLVCSVSSRKYPLLAGDTLEYQIVIPRSSYLWFKKKKKKGLTPFYPSASPIRTAAVVCYACQFSLRKYSLSRRDWNQRGGASSVVWTFFIMLLRLLVWMMQQILLLFIDSYDALKTNTCCMYSLAIRAIFAKL